MKKLFTANCIFILVLLGMQAIAGNVDTIQIQSNYLKKATKFVVIQPSHQGLQNNTQVRYPVVYLLNGYGGDYGQWPITTPQLKKTADDLKIIFVCPTNVNILVNYVSWTQKLYACLASNF